jgi:isocitrate lyase
MSRIQVYLALAALFTLLTAGWYISSLRNRLEAMSAERDKYKKAAETVSDYVRLYEQAKQDNDSKTQELSSMVEAMPDDTCPVPDSVRSIIGRM